MEIPLTELASAFAQSDVRQGYVDLVRGAVVLLPERMAEEAAMERMLALEEDWERYVMLPNLYDGEEKNAMRRFAESRKDAELRRQLLERLAGEAPVAGFRQLVRHLRLQSEWQDSLQEHFLEVARDWCEENGIECRG